MPQENNKNIRYAARFNDFLSDMKRLFGKNTVIHHIMLPNRKTNEKDVYTIAASHDDIIQVARGFSTMKTGIVDFNRYIGYRSSVSNRRVLYSIYDQMELTPEISKALDIYADESTTTFEDGDLIKIICRDKKIKIILDSLYNDILNLQFNLWSWVRNLCKYGDLGVILDVAQNLGIINYAVVPAYMFDRIENSSRSSNEDFDVKFRIDGINEKVGLHQFIHFRLLSDIRFLPYGRSLLEPARIIWRQLTTMEDGMLVYRIVRSPERRIYYVDVTGMKPEQIDSYMQQVRVQLKGAPDIERETGNIDWKFTSLSPLEDLFIPVIGDRQGTRIETLPGGANEGVVNEVEYFQAKLFAALGVPKAFLTYVEDLSGKTTLAAEDIRFSRTISRIQKSVAAELKKIGQIHLFALGYRGSELLGFDVLLSNPSSIAERQKLELVKEKVSAFSEATQNGMSRDWAYKAFFGFTKQDIDLIESQILKDARFAYRVNTISNEGRDPEKEGESESHVSEFGGVGSTKVFGQTTPKTETGMAEESANDYDHEIYDYDVDEEIRELNNVYGERDSRVAGWRAESVKFDDMSSTINEINRIRNKKNEEILSFLLENQDVANVLLYNNGKNRRI